MTTPKTKSSPPTSTSLKPSPRNPMKKVQCPSLLQTNSRNQFTWTQIIKINSKIKMPTTTPSLWDNHRAQELRAPKSCQSQIRATFKMIIQRSICSKRINQLRGEQIQIWAKVVIFIVCIKFKEIKILLKELSLATIWIFLAWVKKWLTARIFSRTRVFWKTGTETLWVCHKVKRFNNYGKASKEIKERMLQMWMITWAKVKRTYCHLVKNITPIWALLLFQLCYKLDKTILQTIIKSSISNLKIEELSNQTAKC